VRLKFEGEALDWRNKRWILVSEVGDAGAYPFAGICLMAQPSQSQ